MIRIVLNEDHLRAVLGEALANCRHRLFAATANVKNVFLPTTSRGAGRDAVGLLDAFGRLAGEAVEVRILHGGVPSGSLLARLKRGMPANVTMRRCPRVHVKAIIADGRRMYLGSANLTGAGLGAKSPRRRNFEAGIWTDDLTLIDPVMDMLEEIWSGSLCDGCGRHEHCPMPLEEPDLATCG